MEGIDMEGIDMEGISIDGMSGMSGSEGRFGRACGTAYTTQCVSWTVTHAVHGEVTRKAQGSRRQVKEKQGLGAYRERDVWKTREFVNETEILHVIVKRLLLTLRPSLSKAKERWA
jgi:hypothetical protein